MKRLILGFVVAFVLGSSFGCAARARHIAVVVDATFAQSVFALDDAEFAACWVKGTPPTTLPNRPAWCDRADPLIKAAIADVKAVSQAVKDTPVGSMPTNLPNLVRTLDAIKTITADLTGPIKAELVSKVQYALDIAIQLLSQFAGGQ